ncbi:M48 family metalloprotease [Streptomyces sp. NPDC002082]|uniref:M48 family metalloprotease n=1 Tax=Streptomyces sp. NPDC002082 TaxID=3154772 RepID=UPI00331DC898
MPTPATTGGPAVDERVLGAGTSVRFATLLFLLLAASGFMILNVLSTLADGDQAGCDLAAGLDPRDHDYWTRAVTTTGQATAYRWCFATWAPPPPWWQVFGWPLMVALVAGALFYVLPLWKVRRGRVVPLGMLDPDGELRSLMQELCAATGVRVPRVVVDPGAQSVGAVVFGRTSRPVVCLHGGLLAVRHGNPDRFRAVLLHELAHIANRDVTLTYATVTLWRSFLGLVILPYLICMGYVLHTMMTGELVPRLSREFLLAPALIAMVYLARADVLRSREIYADLAAARWGADPHGWSVPAPVRQPAGTLRRAAGAFVELWRTHPRWGLRQGALADPEPLFRTAALPLVLIGTVPVLTVSQLMGQVAPYQVNFTNFLMVILVLVPAALVTGVLVFTLWRAVIYAVLTGTRVPTGARAGGWLGIGIAIGMVLGGYGTGSGWLPQRPLILLVPVIGGAALGWWIAQCARLWAATSRGRTLRPALTLSLVGAYFAMISSLTWWMLAGTSLASGYRVNARAAAESLATWLPSAAPGGDASRLPGLTTAVPVMSSIADTPLCALAVTVMWLVPLLAWSAGQTTGIPRWKQPSTAPPDAPVPSLRKVLLPGLLGGALAGVSVVAVQAYLHTEQAAPDARGGLYAFRYALLLLLAVTLPAAIAGALGAGADRRYRLTGSLTAAHTAALLGLLAMCALVSADGCIGPLNVLSDDCALRPVWYRPQFPLMFVLNNTLVLTTLTTFAAVLATTALRRRRQLVRTLPRPESARAASGTWARRLTVTALCTVAVAGTATYGVYQWHLTGLTVDTYTYQRAFVKRFDIPQRPVSARTRLNQVHAWYQLGGRGMVEYMVSNNSELNTVVNSSELRTTLASPESASWSAVDRLARPLCTRWARVDLFDVSWFRVPDPAIQNDWRTMGTWAARGSAHCAQALDTRDARLLADALTNLYASSQCAYSANTRIDTLLRAGGRRGTYRAPNPQYICASQPKGCPINDLRGSGAPCRSRAGRAAHGGKQTACSCRGRWRCRAHRDRRTLRNLVGRLPFGCE